MHNRHHKQEDVSLHVQGPRGITLRQTASNIIMVVLSLSPSPLQAGRHKRSDSQHTGDELPTWMRDSCDQKGSLPVLQVSAACAQLKRSTASDASRWRRRVPSSPSLPGAGWQSQLQAVPLHEMQICRR